MLNHCKLGSISVTYYLMPRGRKIHFNIAALWFSQWRESNLGHSLSSECAIHYSITSWRNNPVESFCLRPSAKDQGITWVVLVLHLVHILIKRNLREKNLPSRDSKLGPPNPHSGTLPTELRRHSYLVFENYLLNSKIMLQTLNQYWSTLVSLVNGSEYLKWTLYLG